MVDYREILRLYSLGRLCPLMNPTVTSPPVAGGVYCWLAS